MHIFWKTVFSMKKIQPAVMCIECMFRDIDVCYKMFINVWKMLEIYRNDPDVWTFFRLEVFVFEEILIISKNFRLNWGQDCP